jgi:hypothetical protein
VVDVCRSVLRGAEGNREFFLHLRPGGTGLDPRDLARVVEEVTGPDEVGNV